MKKLQRNKKRPPKRSANKFKERILFCFIISEQLRIVNMNILGYELEKDTYCWHCMENISADVENENEYIKVGDKIFCFNCVDELIEQGGKEYIFQTQLREYIEWFLNADFKTEPTIRVEVADFFLAYKKAVAQYIKEDVEHFLEWVIANEI